LKLDKNPYIDQDYFNLRNCCPILKAVTRKSCFELQKCHPFHSE
jgi:hypothetical protein